MGFRHVIGFLQYLALKIKGSTMFYTITDEQLRAIKRALVTLEHLGLRNAEKRALYEALEALDIIIQDQGVK